MEVLLEKNGFIKLMVLIDGLLNFDEEPSMYLWIIGNTGFYIT